MRRTPLPMAWVTALALGLIAALLSPPATARADVAGPPVPGDFEDCTPTYRAKGDTTCVDCQDGSGWLVDDDVDESNTCAEQYAGTDFTYVCSRFEYGDTIEVWCDGPYKADCSCRVASGPTPWLGGALVGVGAVALLVARTRRRRG